MSALGQSRHVRRKSHVRFTPKADMCGATMDVRFVPIADIRCRLSMCQVQDRRCPVLEVSFTIVCCRLCQASVL